ncbi:hypothetical protein HED55_04230 [Ochrobactrum haematophilum]|uniref:Uncharacterized protein n=1 Tax=Brucella haematophila TaxID=419474 RepID=A0ABX1DIU9_9HYPH|nr:hypothetical protein [Brucella haematophila]
MVIVTAPALVPRILKLPVYLIFIISIAVLAAYNILNTFGTVASASSFSQTSAVETMNEISSQATNTMTAIYSANLPLDSAPFEKTYNSFQFTAENTVSEIQKIKPDIIIIDKLWSYNDPKLYETAARQLGLVKFTVNRAPEAAMCDYQGESSFADCLSALLGERGSTPAPVYEIYVDRNEIQLLKFIKGDVRELGTAY